MLVPPHNAADEPLTTLRSRFPLSFQGKYDDAEPLYERLTAIKEKALGRDHPDVATVLNSRAGLMQNQVKAARHLQQRP